MDPAVADPADIITSVDGEVFNAVKARRQAKRMFLFGLLFLPLLWIMNIWLFWPDFISSTGDAYIKRYTRMSAVGVAITSVLSFPWFLFYVSSGSRLMNQDTYNRLDVTRFDINSVLGF